MSPEIQRADDQLRIRWLAVLTIAAAAGAVGIVRLDDYLSELHIVTAAAQPATAARARLAVRVILALITAGGVLFSLYLGSVSWRTLSSDRYPPPGARVFSDTRIRHGPAARRHGYAALALALLTLFLTLAVVARAHRVFDRMLDDTLKPTRIRVG